MDIKETKELICGLEKIAIIGAKVFKDGKINFGDLMHLKELALYFSKIKVAIDGIRNIDDELKDFNLIFIISNLEMKKPIENIKIINIDE